ncbi:MAG: hypothetical protein WCO51_10125, partial [bacterium]
MGNTLKWNDATKTWDTAVIKAQIISKTDAVPQQLVNDFKVEDAPDSSAAPAIKNNILKVSDKSVLADHITAQFTVSVDKPDPKVFTQQLGFTLKVIAKPTAPPLPWSPVPVDAMLPEVSGLVTVYLEPPPNRIGVKPNDDPLVVDAVRGERLEVTAVCETYSFEHKDYVPMLGAELDFKITQGEMADFLRKATLPPVPGGIIFQLGVPRFLPGDGQKRDLASVEFKPPEKSSGGNIPSKTLKIQCSTKTIMGRFHLSKTKPDGTVSEFYRKDIPISTDSVKLTLNCADKNFRWEGVSLVVEVTDTTPFYLKTHREQLNFTLSAPAIGASALDVGLMREPDQYATSSDAEIIFPNPDDRKFKGYLAVGKAGWEQFSGYVEELMPGQDAEEVLKLADLMVYAKAIFSSPEAGITITKDDPKEITIDDIQAEFQAGENESWNGAYDPDKHCYRFTNPHRPTTTPATAVPIICEMKPEPTFFQPLSKTCVDAMKLSSTLAPALDVYVRKFLTHIAKMRLAELQDNFQDLSNKAIVISDYVVQSTALLKNLELAYNLRAKVAEEVINNMIGFLVEMGSYSLAWTGKAKKETLEKSSKLALVTTQKEVTKELTEYSEKTIAGKAGVLKPITDKLELLHKQQDVMWKDIAKATQDGMTDKAAAWTKQVEEISKKIIELRGSLKATDDMYIHAEKMLKKYQGWLELDGDDFNAAFKELQNDIGFWTALKGDAVKKVLTEGTKQDFLLYYKCRGEYGERKQKVLEDMPSEYGFIDLIYNGDPEKAAEINEAIYNDLCKVMEYLAQELIGSVRCVFNYISHLIREYTFTNHALTSEYLATYTAYSSSHGMCLKSVDPSTISKQKTIDVMTGRDTAQKVSAQTYTPSKADKEIHRREWTEMDNTQMQQFKDHVIALIDEALRKDTVQPNSYAAFRSAYSAASGLADRIKAYFDSYEDTKKGYYEQIDQFLLSGGGDRAFSYQHLQNMVD